MEKYVPVIVASKQISESAESLATLLGVKVISYSETPPDYSVVFPIGKARADGMFVPKEDAKYIYMCSPTEPIVLSTRKEGLLNEINTEILNQESSLGDTAAIRGVLDAKTEGCPDSVYEFNCYVFHGRAVSLVVTKDSTRAELLQKEVGKETAADLIARGFIADPDELVKITCDAHEVHPKLIKACSAAAERMHHYHAVCLYALKGRYTYEKFNSYDNVTLNELDGVSSHVPMWIDKVLMNPSLTRGNSMVAIADSITEVVETINLFKDLSTIENLGKAFEDNDTIGNMLRQGSLSDIQSLYRAGQYVSLMVFQGD